MTAPGRRAATRERSLWVDIDGPLHYVDFGGPARAPVLVCVHGLDGSAVNWSAIAPRLADQYRVLAPDLAGHGLTRSAGRGTDVASNRALLHRFIDAVPGRPVWLVGNSMGGMLSVLEAGMSASSVSGLVLISPALPFVPAVPDPVVAAVLAMSAMPGVGALITAGRRRVPAEVPVATMLRMCCADPRRVPADVVARHVEVARQRAGFGEAGRDLAAATRSVIATAGYLHGQQYRRLAHAVGCPVLLLHGALDRLVPAAAARAAARAHPSWTVQIMPGIGHVPQLEAPAETALAIRQWIGAAGRPATGTRPGTDVPGTDAPGIDVPGIDVPGTNAPPGGEERR